MTEEWADEKARRVTKRVLLITMLSAVGGLWIGWALNNLPWWIVFPTSFTAGLLISVVFGRRPS